MSGIVRENVALRVSNEVAPDGFGIKDYLSRLPVLCLLGVFNNLAGMQIRTMKTVSKLMFSIGNEQSLKKILDREGGDLTISQTENGYGFELVLCTNGIISTHIYEIWINNGKYEERMNVYDKDNNVPLPIRCFNDPHNLPIPEKFYTALKKITHIHEAKSVLFELTVDAQFIVRIENAFIGHRIKKLNFMHISYNLSVAQQSCNKLAVAIRKKFAKVVRNVKILKITTSKQAVALVNEDLFHKFGESNMCEMNCEYNSSSSYDNRFYPTASILPHLIKFKNLKVLSMTLNADWITYLVMMVLEKFVSAIPKPEKMCDLGEWIFAIDKMLTPEMIYASIRKSDYEYSNGGYDNNHTIHAKNNDLYAVFHTQTQMVDDEAIQYLLIAHFKYNPKLEITYSYFESSP